MPQEQGVVVTIDGAMARVKVSRSSACGQCGSKKMCHAMGVGNEMLVMAHNPLCAAIGQEVLLSLPAKTFLRASVLVYLLPVVALFAGALIGQGFSDDAAVLGAFAGLGLSFLWLYRYNKKVKPHTYSPTITRIVD